MTHHIVYETKCLISNKIYVGCHTTENIDDGYLGSGKILRQAIKKYGKKDFQRTILKEFSNSKDMFEYENHVVNEEFIALPNTYNIVVGGSGGFNVQDKEDWLRKIKIAAGNRTHNPALGNKHTEKAKKLISDANKKRGHDHLLIQAQLKRGSKWCNNGIKEKMLQEIPEGWVQGRICKTLGRPKIQEKNIDQN